MKYGKVIWLYGLSGSGKTTLAKTLVKRIPNSYHLDGDVLRSTAICKDLGFSLEDRKKNLLRASSLAKILTSCGINVICSFITPIEQIRSEIRQQHKYFLDVYVQCSLKECKRRDPKGLYKMALRKEILNFTGIDSPFEEPEKPDLIINTETNSIKESINMICEYYGSQFQPALYIGRWQTKEGLHSGHKAIIQKSLDQNKPVLIAIRNTIKSEKNPYSFPYLKKKIEKYYNDEDVTVIQIPDLESINYGRKVGYKVIQHHIDKELEEISGTALRNQK